MFDGSYRTNKREINLAGASASSRSSRTSNLDEARRQRLARAEALAKTNGAICLQRCWRGCYARSELAIDLAMEYGDAICSINDITDKKLVDVSPHELISISDAACKLAFRMSPALVPFFAFRYTNKPSPKEAEVEERLRSEILWLSTALWEHDHSLVIPPFAAKRIISVILILLRQTAQRPLRSSEELRDTTELVELLDALLTASCSRGGAFRAALTVPDCKIHTNRPSDYHMSLFKRERSETTPSVTGWMVDLFLCFRDFMPYHNAENDLRDRLLLKWCCGIIIFFSTLEQQTMKSPVSPPQYQQSLALLASIMFSTHNFESLPWITDRLSKCMLKLDQQSDERTGEVQRRQSMQIPSSPFLMLINNLATVMNTLSAHPTRRGSNALYERPSFTSNFLSRTSANLMDALCDTIRNRECITLNNVINHANACQQRPQLTQESVIYAIPIILQYALQNHRDFAILACFAARGENIASWILDNRSDGRTDVASTASMAVVAAYEVDDVSDDSNDDEHDAPVPYSPQRSASRDSPGTSPPTGMPSRADLQTVPKLDALFQAGVLKAKKGTVERLRSELRNQGNNVKMLMMLAETIGKGAWLQQLGDSLFSPTPTAPVSWPGLQVQAQIAYNSALATVITSCSGIRAGRNAASPLLARFALNDHFLHMLWVRSIGNVHLLSPQSKATDASAIASACEVFSSFCDVFSHHLLAVNDDDFLERYHKTEYSKYDRILAKDLVLVLKMILNDLYWIRPVVASDITISQSDPDYAFRFQRARLFLSGTKLWNSLYDRWCRLYRVVQFCAEDCWWFPHLASRGQHENNPIIHSQATTFIGHDNDEMDDSSIESTRMEDGDFEAASLSINDAGGDALASAFRDPKMARVLSYIPQAMPFSRRVSLFNSLLESDKMLAQDESMSLRQMMMNVEEGNEAELPGRERVTIRRDALYSDSKGSLNSLGKRLRKRIQVTFVNKLGRHEAGIDGGGVFKEFLDDLIKDAFLPATVKETSGEMDDDDNVEEIHPDFFSVTPLQTLKVNTELDGKDSLLVHYEFLGRVLGKAIYESILVEPQFSLLFLNKLLGKQNSLDDLKNLDPEYYKNLMSLRHMSAPEIANLGLTFELYDSATITSLELMPGGSSITVTKENVIQYIHLVSHQKMNVRGSRQTMAFLHGFRDIIPAQWVRLFSANELQKLISGDDAIKGIDVQGMQSVMRYSGGFHPSQPIVQWLWEVVDAMSPGQQRKFLKFMTSCSRQPLLGFASMVPAPCIQQIRLREDDHGMDIAEELNTGNIRLPTSSTCMNLLKLPKYTSKEMLREKLLYAIEAAAGFELS
ncbi:hypothetical protein ACHAXH_006378 [Discostella pseudostelligera]